MSLLHVSINAADPERVASFLAAILGGEALLFPPFPGCWIALAAADDGTAIEVYPDTHVLVAGPEQIECVAGERNTAASFVHLALASPLSREQIIALAGRQHWTSRLCDRGHSPVSRCGWKTASSSRCSTRTWKRTTGPA